MFLSNIVWLCDSDNKVKTTKHLATLQFHSFHSFRLNGSAVCWCVKCVILPGAPPCEGQTKCWDFHYHYIFPLFHFQRFNSATFWTNSCSPCQLKCMLLHLKQMQNEKKISWKAVSGFWTPMYSQMSGNQVCQCLSSPRSTISSRLRRQKFCGNYSRCWEILCIQCVGMCWNDELDVLKGKHESPKMFPWWKDVEQNDHICAISIQNVTVTITHGGLLWKTWVILRHLLRAKLCICWQRDQFVGNSLEFFFFFPKADKINKLSS